MCLHRPAPQSKRGLKENEIIKARADQIKTACVKIIAKAQTRGRHNQKARKQRSNRPGAAYGGVPPKRGCRWLWWCKIFTPVIQGSLPSVRLQPNCCIFTITGTICYETNNSCFQQNSLGETL